jgi:hypothetical protein
MILGKRWQECKGVVRVTDASASHNLGAAAEHGGGHLMLWTACRCWPICIVLAVAAAAAGVMTDGGGACRHHTTLFMGNSGGMVDRMGRVDAGG